MKQQLYRVPINTRQRADAGESGSSVSVYSSGAAASVAIAREVWKQAEDRNRETTELYDRLGLPEYQALEAFIRWRGPASADVGVGGSS